MLLTFLVCDMFKEYGHAGVDNACTLHLFSALVYNYTWVKIALI